jgi:hypothetical protein
LDTGRPLDEINFEFTDDTTGEWEYVMIQHGEKRKGEGEDDGDG